MGSVGRWLDRGGQQQLGLRIFTTGGLHLGWNQRHAGSLGTEWKIPVKKVGLALRGGAYLNTASEAQDLDAVVLTAGLGLRIFDFNLDLAAGASPKTEKVDAVDDEEIPSRANASVMISFRRNF